MINNNFYIIKTILSIPVKINIQIRFYPFNANGGKKIADLFVKEVLKTPNLIGAIKPAIPILVYDSIKIQDQLINNHILKKYLSIYEKNGVLIPHPIETFPQITISGQYTLSDKHKLFLENDEQYLLGHSYVLARYALTMYGGKEIKDVSDILHRLKQLFTEDNFIKFYSYPKESIQGNDSLFPLLQHWLSMDTYHMRFLTNIQSYPSNLNLSQKTLSLSRNLELQIILKTHKFKFDENSDEIRFLDCENNTDLVLIKKNSSIINIITKQEEPEALGQCVVGMGKKIVYPIETKLIGNPEKYLPMFNGFSSISPLYQGLSSAEKVIGDLSVKMIKQPHCVDIIVLEELKRLIKDCKNSRINKNIFNEEYKQWIIRMYNDKIKSGKLFYEHTSYFPSIITSAFPLDENNFFQKLQKENPEFIHYMIKDISKTIDFKKHFPSYQQMKSYTFYDNNLSFMLMLKKYNLLENYYSAKKLLLNIDIDV